MQSLAESPCSAFRNLDAHSAGSVQSVFVVKKYLAVLLILLAILASYAPAVNDGFVWDDSALILRDPLIRSWRLIPEGFNHFLFVDATASDFYRPLQRLTYTLDYGAFAFRPAAYHIVNILWHAAAAVALFCFAEELLLAFGVDLRKRRVIALLATLVWAVHPIQNAAVVYVSGRADPLAATFGFIACYLILRSLRATARGKIFLFVSAGVALLLSALSKETGLIFPPLLIVLLAVMKKGDAIWKTVVVTAFVCVIYLSLRLAAEHNPAPELGRTAPWTVRPITVARAVAEYTGLIALPLNLHMDRQIEARSSGPEQVVLRGAAQRELQTLVGILLIVAAVYWAVRARRRDPVVFTFLILAAITYLPVSGIVVLNASVAEHWIYLPSAFVFLAATAAVTRLFQTRRWRRSTLIGISLAFAAWLAFLGTRTFVRTFDWKDQRTFLVRTIAAGGDSSRMLTNLGGLEINEGRLDLAKKHLQEALRKEPDQPFAVINLAAVALKENDFKAARQLLTRAAQMPPVAAQAYELLAVLENKEHRRADLLRLRLAARTGAVNWSIEKRYIKLLDETGATAAAIAELQTCLQTQWYRAESWQLLSQLLAKTGRTKEAAIALTYANAYDVHLAEHGNLL
jgi:tetratricopeptide (TPR) repeat protein